MPNEMERTVRRNFRSERQAQTFAAIADKLRAAFHEFTDDELRLCLAGMVETGEVNLVLNGSGEAAYYWAPQNPLALSRTNHAAQRGGEGNYSTS